MKAIKSKLHVPKRYIIVLMIFLAYSNVTILHTNLSMAVLDMTTMKNITAVGVFELKAEFNWTAEQKSLILSSYSYGRLFGPIGGILAGKLGGATTCCIGNFAMAAITLCSPLLVSADFTLFIIMYIIFGVFESFLWGGIPEIISRWAPIDERSRFVACGEVGLFFGSIASFALSGVLLEKCDWRTLFYGSGLASLILAAIWWFVVNNDPSEDKFLSEAELKYIQDGKDVNDADEKIVYPWKRIITFVPLWISSLAEFSVICGLIFTSVFLPQYIKDATNADIENIGFISTIPQICALISMPTCGYFADYIRSLKILSITNVHKLFASVTLFSIATFYAVTAIFPSFLVDIAAISLYQFCCSLFLVDVTVLFLDISPRYTAIFMSIVNFCAIFSGFVVPIVVEFIVTSNKLSQWNICFVLYSIFSFSGALLCMIFISAEQPKWALVERTNLNETPNTHYSNMAFRSQEMQPAKG